MNVTLSGIVRALRWELALLVMPRPEPEAVTVEAQPEGFLMTEEDITVLEYTARVNTQLTGVPDDMQLRLPSGNVVAARWVRRWIADNAQPGPSYPPAECTCRDCEAETLGATAAEMGLLLQRRRMGFEFVDGMTLAEHTLFGFIMAHAVDGAELDFAQRVIADFHASVDAGDTDGKD